MNMQQQQQQRMQQQQQQQQQQQRQGPMNTYEPRPLYPPKEITMPPQLTQKDHYLLQRHRAHRASIRQSPYFRSVSAASNVTTAEAEARTDRSIALDAFTLGAVVLTTKYWPVELLRDRLPSKGQQAGVMKSRKDGKVPLKGAHATAKHVLEESDQTTRRLESGVEWDDLERMEARASSTLEQQRKEEEEEPEVDETLHHVDEDNEADYTTGHHVDDDEDIFNERDDGEEEGPIM